MAQGWCRLPLAHCDARREKSKKAEREANVDPLSKPIWPKHKQPGMQAMVKAGTKLMADHACSVLMMPIPAPGAVADGWDIADAIAQGWTADQVRDFIRSARPFVPPNDEARAKASFLPAALMRLPGRLMASAWWAARIAGRSAWPSPGPWQGGCDADLAQMGARMSLGGAIALGLGVWWHKQHAAAAISSAVVAERTALRAKAKLELQQA